MDSLDGSEQGWEVNSRAECRNHPTVPTAPTATAQKSKIFLSIQAGESDQGPG